jgi:hypothetical protein
MNGLVPTEEIVAQLQLEVDELKKSYREAVWKQSVVLGPPEKKDDWPEVFVLMPFRDELKPVYEGHIKKSIAKLKLRIGRGDEIFGPGPIVNDVWSAIHAARVIVADCTGRNPNVFYEIGLAHAVGRHTILISQSLDDIPFDLRHLRTIQYEYTPPGMKAFEKILIEMIRRACPTV